MCGFNRRIMINNCIIVPAIPIQTGIGGPMVGGVSPVMPNMMNNCAMPNNTMPEPFVPNGTMPAGNLSGFTCNANFETTQRVMEPPLQCPPTIIHHHNRVQHMVPCVKTNIHHVHNHHEWLPFEQSEVNEVVNHSHGARPTDLQLCNSVR